MSNYTPPLPNSTATATVAPADYRHRACGRLLFRGVLMVGTVIEVRCPKCGKMHVIDTRVAGLTASKIPSLTMT